jgi:hypothetical protein
VLRDWLRGTLPDYMIPSEIVLMTGLPLTGNGKLDASALPPPDRPGDTDRARAAAPATPTEAALAPIWLDVLGVETIGVDANFFLITHKPQPISAADRASAESVCWPSTAVAASLRDRSVG